MPSPSFLFSVFAIPLFFPIEGKISCYYYYFFVFFSLSEAHAWSFPPFMHLSAPSMELRLPGCPQNLTRHKLLAEPDPYGLQAPLALFAVGKPCACVGKVWWGGTCSESFFPAPVGTLQMSCTVPTQHPDLCETSRIDAFIDSNLVFQRSLHVTKRAAGVI